MTDLPRAVVEALIAQLDARLKRGSAHRAYCRAKGHAGDPYRKDYLYEVTTNVPACRRCVQGIIATLKARLAHFKAQADIREKRITQRMRRRTA